MINRFRLWLENRIEEMSEAKHNSDISDDEYRKMKNQYNG